MKLFSFFVLVLAFQVKAENTDELIIKNLEFFENMEMLEKVKDVDFLLEEEEDATDSEDEDFED